jgi:hypothetical protein
VADVSVTDLSQSDNVIELTGPRHARVEGRHRAPRVPLTERMVDGVLDGVAAGVAKTAPVLVPVIGAGALSASTIFAGGGVAAAATATHTSTTSSTAETGTGASTRSTSGFQLPTGTPYAAPTALQLQKLRGCESGGNYAINTGNGFYGAYQFNQGTWAGLGLPGLASQGSPALQDAAASALEMERGWEPWPACSASLGLSTRKAGAISSTAILTDFTSSPSSATQAASPTATPKVAAGRHAVPAFAGKVLSTALSSTYRSDVRTWQQRMADRGWPIVADGYFGPHTAEVAQAFAAEKGLHVALPGEVDATVWTSAWTLPVN